MRGPNQAWDEMLASWNAENCLVELPPVGVKD